MSALKKIALIPAWILEIFKTCRSFKNQKYDGKTFYIVGHRGSPTKEVENTIPSFERAIQDGANSLEMDLCITSDNKVIIWHDWDPDSTTALLRDSGFEPTVKYRPYFPDIGNDLRQQVCNLTFDEFISCHNYTLKDDDGKNANAEIPLLEDFFKWGIEQKKLLSVNFDIKVPKNEFERSFEILKTIKDFIDKYKPKFNIIIETVEEFVLLKMKEKFPEFNYLLDVEPSFGIILDPNDYSAIRAAIKYKNEYSLAFMPRQITIANWITHRRIIRNDVKIRLKYNADHSDKTLQQLFSATINKKIHLICLIKQGVGGIVTDYPELLHKLAVKYKRKIE